MRELLANEISTIGGGCKSDEYLATGIVMGAAGGLLLMTGVADAMGAPVSPWLYVVEALFLLGSGGAHVMARYHHDDLGL